MVAPHVVVLTLSFGGCDLGSERVDPWCRAVTTQADNRAIHCDGVLCDGADVCVVFMKSFFNQKRTPCLEAGGIIYYQLSSLVSIY